MSIQGTFSLSHTLTKYSDDGHDSGTLCCLEENVGDVFPVWELAEAHHLVCRTTAGDDGGSG